ncbi:PadR family transcriptional regulator [Neobacillus sp. 114]|uniref:PadR family transcriptional regulator n=1 Tax=Neobacillus sp. 114 TaxID=3048535 RepID=UPI0024C27B24|nr:PadR family transcriptional regulator [Neobacillus sp. 114]
MTRLMVLGMLRTKPMSGYEMQQQLQVSEVDKWAGILPGSIYHALKKMDKEGLVRVANVEATGHRVKAIYEITEEGDKEYKNLLISSFSEPSVHLPVLLYTGLSMFNLPNHDIDTERIIAAIEEQKQVLLKKMDDIEAGQKIKAQFIEVNELAKITFQNILDQYKLQIEFLDKIILAMTKGA